MAFDDRQLAALLQTTRDFARDMLEQTGALIPFGGQVKPDGEFEFFVLAQPGEQLTREDAYRQIETALAERAGRGDILAGVIALDMVVPEAIATPLRDAIGILIETPDFARFFHATFKLTPAGAQGAKGSVDYGEIVPLDAKPGIFAKLH